MPDNSLSFFASLEERAHDEKKAAHDYNHDQYPDLESCQFCQERMEEHRNELADYLDRGGPRTRMRRKADER